MVAPIACCMVMEIVSGRVPAVHPLSVTASRHTTFGKGDFGDVDSYCFPSPANAWFRSWVGEVVGEVHVVVLEEVVCSCTVAIRCLEATARHVMYVRSCRRGMYHARARY